MVARWSDILSYRRHWWWLSRRRGRPPRVLVVSMSCPLQHCQEEGFYWTPLELRGAVPQAEPNRFVWSGDHSDWSIPWLSRAQPPLATSALKPSYTFGLVHRKENSATITFTRYILCRGGNQHCCGLLSARSLTSEHSRVDSTLFVAYKLFCFQARAKKRFLVS